MTMKTNMLRDAIKFALAVGATAAVGTGVAFAQDAAPAPAEQEATTLDRIQVTGSRIRRTDIETSQPVFSLSREDIQAQGLTSVGDVIQNITASGSALNSTFNNGGNGETRISLRNLGSNRTLVLVNGRRWVGGTGLGGAVDLNTIPTAAVERIEILKDGASAIYGSDAIAGVVNVILRQNFDGAEANAYIGQYDQGDGQRTSVDFTVGSSGDRWSAMMGVGYVEEDAVMAGDREISAVPLFGASQGFGGSFATPTGNFAIIDPATGEWQRPDGEYGIFIPDASDPRGWRPYAGSVDNYNFAPDNFLVTPQERTSLFANGSVEITDNVRFVATAQYNERRSSQLLASMPIFIFGERPGVSPDSVYNPYGRAVNAIGRRFNESGFRIFSQDVNTWAFDGSFQGSFEVGERFFDWEAGMFYGRNDQSDTTNGLIQISRLDRAIGPSFFDADGIARCGTPTAVINDCVPLNILGGLGSITQEMSDGVTFVAHDNFGYTQKTHYANIGGELFDLPAGALAFSFGLEQREESGFDDPDALINSGDTSGNARTATSGGYDVDEVYLELAIPVLADLPFAKLLDFSVASRYSDYSTFGDTINSKFGFRWKPIDDLMFRGNWAEGFRAPSIGELFSGQADSFPNLTDPCNGSLQGAPNTDRPAACAGIPAYNQPNTQIRITVGGNPFLQPETSTSKTLGLVYSPSFVEGLDFALDWWNIRLENTVSAIGANEILTNCYREGNPNNECSLITRNADGSIADLLSSGINRGSEEVEGYDLTVGYRLPENSWGRFSFTWDTTYLALNELNDDGDNNVGEYFNNNNNWRIRSNLATRWEQGDFGATWIARYFSGMDESCSSIATSQRANVCSDPTRRTADGQRPENYIPSVVYNDASVYWKAPWNARITLGANNILDRDPPRSATAFANSFDPQMELPGRFYYMRYSQSF